MLTKTGRTLAGGAAAFLFAGVAFGNWPFFGAGALLLLLLSSSALARQPTARLRVHRARVERGGSFRFEMEVDVPRGVGVAEVHQDLPEEFDLVSGNNFHVLTFGIRKRIERFEFTTKAPKRGEYALPPVRVKVLHPLGFATSQMREHGAGVTLTVVPRPLGARIPRDLRTRAHRPFPEGDQARLGLATNDFRELREYVPGDPPRRINWKASARRMGSGASDVPLVNETEWEGKKSVWILVDGHARMSVGTTIEDAREHAADAALSIMEQYLRRGFQVGLALARSGDLPPLRPGTGEAQVVRARELLSRLRAAPGPSFMDVLQRDAALLVRGKPLVVVVTRLAGGDEDLRAALVRLGAIGRAHGRTLVPGLVIDVEMRHADPSGLVPGVARRALDHGRVEMRAAARAAGLRVTEWRAGEEPLEAVLIRGRIA